MNIFQEVVEDIFLSDTSIGLFMSEPPKPFICEPLTTRRMDIIEHIYSRCTVEDRGYETPCYIWQGGHTGHNGRGANYPKMSLDGQSVRVHRVVFCHFEGYLHSKRQVDHKCGQRMCVRYEHLRKATQKQNCLFRDQKNGVVRRKRRRKAKRGNEQGRT